MSLMSIPSLSEVDSISDFEFSSVDFEIISKIGEGYFSDVFLVECATTGNKMVKKQTKPDRDPGQLLNEMEMLRSVPEHLNILSFYGEVITDSCDVTTNGLFEFCGGGDLHQEIEHAGPLPIPLSKKYIRDLTRGVAHLHKNQILHRDLKSENLFITTTGTLKIADFGSAVKMKSGIFLSELEGSPINCSPEMIKGNNYSFPRDWWSVGIIIFHISVGYMPFDGTDQMDLFVKILLNPPRFPKSLSPNLVNLINGLLNKNPTERFGSAEVLSNRWIGSSRERKEKISFQISSSDSE